MTDIEHRSHRKFNAHRLIDKFARGGEPILHRFVRHYLPESELAKAETITVEAFLALLAQPKDSSELKHFHKLLHKVYDLATNEGAFYIRTAAREMKVRSLPTDLILAEHLSLMALADVPEVFLAAYDRLDLGKTDNFTFHVGREPREIDDSVAVARLFEPLLRDVEKDGDAIVRSFREGDMVNFVFYYERKPRSPLVFKDHAIEPLVHRPTDQDFICFNTRTGHLEIEVGNRWKKDEILKRFARAAFNDEEFFAADKFAKILDLDCILADDFNLSAFEAKLTALTVTVNQDECPAFTIESSNVLTTIERNGMRAMLRGGHVQHAQIRLKPPGAKKAVLIELSDPKGIGFQRSMHTEAIFSVLRTLGLMAKANDVAPVTLAIGAA